MGADYSAERVESIIRRWAPIGLIVATMVGLKLALLAADAAPFNSDEAVVGLMARHISRGERPVFFYGQAYLGSLDAWLIAIAFSVFGDSVASIRLVQIVLFAGTTLTAYLIARRLLADEWAARVVAVLFAIPIPLVTTYTTATLGGYGETLLIGNGVLLLAYRLSRTPASRGLWLAIGLLTGVGFWTSVMTLVYVVPAVIWLMWTLHRRIESPQSRGERRGFIWKILRPQRLGGETPTEGRSRYLSNVLIAAAAFVVGSLPWWVALIELQGAPLLAMLGLGAGRVAGGEPYLQSVGTHALYFLLFGVPVLFGLRYPWSPQWVAPLLAPIALILNVVAISYAVRRRQAERAPLWGIVGCLMTGFLLTSFGNDPSGRYFLPLYLPLTVFIADVLARLRARQAWVGRLSLAALLGYNLLTNGLAALQLPPGITTQFDAVTSIEWRRDRELLDFLNAHGITRGYSNYWVTFRIAFESNEAVIFAPSLPYHTDFRYTSHDDRYPAYTRAVAASPDAAYLTTHFPELAARIRSGLDRLGVTYAETQIADYHLFYDLSRKVEPAELALGLDGR